MAKAQIFIDQITWIRMSASERVFVKKWIY